MKYLGLDLHLNATVRSLLDEQGAIVRHGQVETTFAGLYELVKELTQSDELLVGQEVASSRKKTDKRDAFWIAKALQTGMTPHPVYLPTGEVRELRALLSQRDALMGERTRWRLRARRQLQGAGFKPEMGGASRFSKTLEETLASPDGLPAHLSDAVQRCLRMEKTLAKEIKVLDEQLHERAQQVDAIRRLMTLPAVGELVALTLYATIGNISRFGSARELCSYAGLVPSVRQSSKTQVLGHITGEGSQRLLAILVQAGQVLLWRCKSDESLPLKALAQRVYTTRQRNKIAVVAAARFILRTAYCILRDGSTYDPSRLPKVA